MKWARSRSILKALWKESAGGFIAVRASLSRSPPVTDLTGGGTEGGKGAGVAVLAGELGKHLLSPF